MDVFPLPKEQKDYTYANSQQIKMQTGLIGHLRADFGTSGTEFYSTWFDFRKDLKTDEFKFELDEVINSLRKNGMLKNRNAMRSYGSQHPETASRDTYCTQFHVRVNTDKHAYLFRMNPNKGDYNLYCYCYRRDWLDRHIQQAENGIRFITSNYKDLFRLSDGDEVRILNADGTQQDFVCRYIDDYHVQIGDNLFHICEYAERMERNGCKGLIPLRKSLPEKSYTVINNSDVAAVFKGRTEFMEIAHCEGNAQELADSKNKTLGVTPSQAEAMKAGVLFGWAYPAADPKNYNEQGILFGCKTPNRGDAR